MQIRRVALDLARAQTLDRLCPLVTIADELEGPKPPKVFVPKKLDQEMIKRINAEYGPAKFPKRRKIQSLEVSDWKIPSPRSFENPGG